MGLKIHYRGQLRSYAEIEDLICDVADICVTIGWRMMPVHPSNIMPGKGWIIRDSKEKSLIGTPDIYTPMNQ